MAAYGVTDRGFVLKGLDAILADGLARARQMFGPTVDLTSTSPLRKIIEGSASETFELWKALEDQFYAGFLTTADGPSLDLLGDDLGVPRRELFDTGSVRFTLAAPAPGRTYVIPEGTVVVTPPLGAPPAARAFATTAALRLDQATPAAEVGARALERGHPADVPPGQAIDVDPAYRQVYFSNLAGAVLTVAVTAPFRGGERPESDAVYRARLLGLPRNVFTLDSVARAALDVDGVTDVLATDRLGGVDVSQSVFNLFEFDRRVFSSDRRLGEPYFFDVVVAHEVAWPFRTTGAARGIFERVTEEIDRVRPVGIHPNVIQADHVEVGFSARVTVEPGFDQQSILASIKTRIATNVASLKLGRAVLFSQVMRAFVEEPGVVDVQELRLRRCPPHFGRISFGAVPFQSEVVEAAVGENLQMGPREIAIFRFDSGLIDVRFEGR
jgi:uncharacterized phage protein gp47/JayE